MDKLTTIKIKHDDNTYSDEIPVSVLAENVEWDATHTLVDILGNIDTDTTGSIQDQISQLFNEKVSATQLQNYVASQLNDINVNPVGSAVVVDSSLTISGAAADAKVTGDNFSDLNNHLSEVKRLFSDVVGYKDLLLDATWATGKYIDVSGRESTNAAGRASGYIDVSDNGHLVFFAVNKTDLYAYRVCAYKSDYTFISAKTVPQNEGVNGTTHFTWEFPANTKYIRVAALIPSYGEIITMGAYASSSCWFNAKKWYAIGDSITYGTYSHGTGSIKRNPDIAYPKICSKLLGYKLVNYGVPNLGFTVNATDSQFQDDTIVKVLDNHDFADAELVTVALGTNDYGRDGTLGTIADTSSTVSVYGRFKLIVETLMSKCPTARIIFFTPIPRETVGSANSQYDKNVQNNSGFTFDDVKNAIIESCKYYGIEYFNLTDTFVLNYANHNTYQKDGLHPTIDGHALMAKCIANRIVF